MPYRLAFVPVYRVKTPKMYNQSPNYPVPNGAMNAPGADPYYNYHYMYAGTAGTAGAMPEQLMMAAYEEHQKLSAIYFYMQQNPANFAQPPSPQYFGAPFPMYPQAPPPMPLYAPPPTHTTPPEMLHPAPKDGRISRIPFTAEQIGALMARYNENQFIKKEERDVLSAKIGLTERQIKIWFQNRRHKIRVDEKHEKYQATVADAQKKEEKNENEDADETRD